MILSKEDVKMVMNVLIGDRLNDITRLASEIGAVEGTHKFIESLKDVVKEFGGDRLEHKMDLTQKVHIVSELESLLTGFCKTFRVGLVVGKLSSAKIIKPSLKVVKTVNKSKMN